MTSSIRDGAPWQGPQLLNTQRLGDSNPKGYMGSHDHHNQRYSRLMLVPEPSSCYTPDAVLGTQDVTTGHRSAYAPSQLLGDRAPFPAACSTARLFVCTLSS